MRQRRKLTREFKVVSVRLSRPPGRSVGEVAKSLDVGEGDERGRQLLRINRGCRVIGEDAGQGRSSSNALAESFFATPKKELAHHEVYETREAARASLLDDIEVFYNRERRHSDLGDVSPLAFEQEVASPASIMIRPRGSRLVRGTCMRECRGRSLTSCLRLSSSGAVSLSALPIYLAKPQSSTIASP